MLSQEIKPAHEFGVKYNPLTNEFEGDSVKKVNNYLRARRRVVETLEPSKSHPFFRLEERAHIKTGE